eukprot:679992-Amphidinium_carterae.1
MPGTPSTGFDSVGHLLHFDTQITEYITYYGSNYASSDIWEAVMCDTQSDNGVSGNQELTLFLFVTPLSHSGVRCSKIAAPSMQS